MSEISKEELEKEIAKILKNADLSSTSSKKVRQKLEKSFGTDLTDKRKIIDELVMDYVNNKEKEDSEDEDGDDGEEDEEEEDKKPLKRSAPASKKPKKKARKASSSEVEEDGTNDSDSEGEEKKPAAKKKASKKKGSEVDSDDDWAKKKSKNKKGGGAKGARGKGSGYTRAYKLSPALAELMGQDEMPRHEVVKRVWAIIKEKKLYDPNNKHFAICDDALYKVIGTKRFRAFGMMKYLKSHFLD